MKKKRFNILFICVFFIGLCCSSIRMVFFPKEVNQYENRYANQPGKLSLNAFLNCEFQNQMELVLSDQVPGSEQMKFIYNTKSAGYTMEIMKHVLKHHKDRYFHILGGTVFGGDQLVYNYLALDNKTTQSITKKADNYNLIIDGHPELEFYNYYIERDSDIQFETGEKSQNRDFIFESLHIPANHQASFQIDSYEQFRELFYLTDHHWNHKGADKAYREILRLLGCKDQPLVPGQETLISENFAGCKVENLETDYFKEPFYAYPYGFHLLDVRLNGEKADAYGEREKDWNQVSSDVSYGSFYGWDYGEVAFISNRVDRGNLLIIGESYDNAVIRLLAEHFNGVYAVDMRNFEYYMGKPFHFSEYVQENQIDQVLFMGNIVFYLSDDFLVED